MVVYPRWRGELDRTASVVSSGSGLSPLARGTPVFANLWTIAIRFIPAGAGNTGARNTKPCICSVYPRWRGEHPPLAPSNSGTVGLSPLARGTHVANRLIIIYFRFIPAGAGNTIEIVFGIYSEAVYPRWRGEHSKHNLLLINDFLSQSQSTNFIVSHKQHIHYVKEHLIH